MRLTRAPTILNTYVFFCPVNHTYSNNLNTIGYSIQENCESALPVGWFCAGRIGIQTTTTACLLLHFLPTNHYTTIVSIFAKSLKGEDLEIVAMDAIP